eukprot:gnl/Dysnectes_brevis/2488_a2976_1520.p1 GENE.gnl/Dysnectes_brevis/2488_a2976_1520~~gnl/Dysnectes_brevis/2488_a2976_1520.p1  ORF type:complete len:253 (+),score=62.39 gnl/Dysnectes_brevis/2488_a2976_1520:27-785(+)
MVLEKTEQPATPEETVSTIPSDPVISPLTALGKQVIKDIDFFVFDYDGTLVDSLSAWDDVDRIFFEKRGMVVPLHWFDDISGYNLRQCAEYVRDRFKITETPEEIMKEWIDLATGLYRDVIKPVPGVIELLDYLKQQGKRIGIASALSKDLITVSLTSLKLGHYFETVVTTADVESRKPEPAVYLECIKRLDGESSRAVVFEDTLAGLEGGRRAGCRTVAVLTGGKKEQAKRDSSTYAVRDMYDLIGQHPQQ